MAKANLKDIEVIVFDVDGTLLADDGTIGENTKDLVKKLKKKGVQFSFATGRLHSAVVNFAKELNIRSPLISLDGCLLKSYPDNIVLFESYVKEKHVKRVIAYAELFMINVCLCHDEAIFYTEANSVIPRITEKFGAPFKQVELYESYTKNTLEVLMAGDNREAVKYVYDRMSFPYCTGLDKSFFRSHTYDNIFYLEIRRSGSSKGKGLQRLLKYLQIPESRAAVVGDWYNDLSLFRKDTLNVAVANAVAELKRNADIVTKNSNNEDGAAEFLEMVLNSKK